MVLGCIELVYVFVVELCGVGFCFVLWLVVWMVLFVYDGIEGDGCLCGWLVV